MLPIPAARKSMPRSAIILHSFGSAHSPIPITPSSSPPMEPTSASRDIPCLCADLNQLFGLCNVLFDRIMRTVEHDGGETCLDTHFRHPSIAAVVKVKSYRNSDVHLFHHTFYHANNGFVTGHVFACTLGNTKDNGRIAAPERLPELLLSTPGY